MAEIAYNDFYEKNNLNISKLNIKDVRNCITNLILYGREIGEDIPKEFLINTLYLLRNFEEKYKNNEEKLDINIDDLIRELDENDDNNDNNININEIVEKQNNEDENIIET